MGMLRGAGLGVQAVAVQWASSFQGVLSWHPLTPSLRNRASAWGKESLRQELGSAGKQDPPLGAVNSTPRGLAQTSADSGVRTRIAADL